jgi:hypothetical protein
MMARKARNCAARSMVAMFREVVGLRLELALVFARMELLRCLRGQEEGRQVELLPNVSTYCDQLTAGSWACAAQLPSMWMLIHRWGVQVEETAGKSGAMTQSHVEAGDDRGGRAPAPEMHSRPVCQVRSKQDLLL